MTWTQFEKDKYRFSCERYSFRGANGSRPSEYVPQLPGFYAFPKDGSIPDYSSSSFESSIFRSSSSSLNSSSSSSILLSSSSNWLTTSSSEFGGVGFWEIGKDFIVSGKTLSEQESDLSSISSSSYSLSSSSSVSSSSLSSQISSSLSSQSSSSLSSQSSSSLSSQSSSSLSSQSSSSVSSTSQSSESFEILSNNVKRRAVIVSIEDYPESYVGDLTNMTHVPLDNVANRLTNKFGFTIFARLKDQQATVPNVVAKIVEATTDLTAGDSFVFMYAGHGSSQATWASPSLEHNEEGEQANELLSLYNGNLADDTLRELIDAMPQGIKITFILDMCHAGTGTRTPVVKKPRMMGEEQMREILFAASAETGLGYLMPEYGPLFTHAMLTTFDRYGNKMSAYEFFDRTMNALLHYGGQAPQLEGPESLKNSRVFIF